MLHTHRPRLAGSPGLADAEAVRPLAHSVRHFVPLEDSPARRPEDVRFLEAQPRTSAGKVDRRGLAARHASAE